MAKKELSKIEIAESIPDLWSPLTPSQREYLAQNFTIQKFKKNEVIYCEGETPMHLMCLLSGKVKIYKDGVATDYSEEEATVILSQPEVTVLVDMKNGSEEATAWGCDLSYDYVKINADYRS